MNYLETLLQSAQEEAKRLQEEVRTLRETLDHKVKTASGYEHTEEYVKPKPLETKELEVKLQRLAAYFTKRAKENTKRAEKLDYEVRNTFMCHGESEKKDNNAYYHSGKADTYLRAAGKVWELLGNEQRYNALAVPANSEKWIIEMQRLEGEWTLSSWNDEVPFPSKEAAEKTYAKSKNDVTYRARRIDVPEKWIVEVQYAAGEWGHSTNCKGVYDTKEESEQSIVDNGSKSMKYRIVKENQ